MFEWLCGLLQDRLLLINNHSKHIYWIFIDGVSRAEVGLRAAARSRGLSASGRQRPSECDDCWVRGGEQDRGQGWSQLVHPAAKLYLRGGWYQDFAEYRRFGVGRRGYRGVGRVLGWNG